MSLTELEALHQLCELERTQILIHKRTQKNTKKCMDSDTNSNTTVYISIFQFNNSDLETPDKLDNSEPSPSTFS